MSRTSVAFVAGLAATVAAGRNRHVVFIVIDDLRPEMTPYGHEYMVTPNFEALANRSLVFDNAYANQAICAPSRNSFMTGRRPDKTHAWNFVQHFRDSGVGDKWTTFPGLFKQRGFLALGAGKTFHPDLPPNFDGANSWSNFTGPHSQELPYFDIPTFDCPKPTPKLARCSTDGDDDYIDIQSVNHSLSLLQDGLATGKPVALFVGLRKPHLPFRRPDRFNHLYPSWTEIPLAKHRVIPNATPLIAWHDTGDNVDPWTPHQDADERQARHAYRATVSFADEMVGRVLQGVKDAGIANDTAIFLWSDHGWQLSEHGQWRKMTIFELATRVPLMIHVPWLPQSQNRRTSAMAELVDLMPTAAELMGIDLMPNETIDGTSLLPVLQDPTASVKDAAFSQYPRCPRNTSVLWKKNNCMKVNDTAFFAMGYSIRVKDWRYSEWPRWDGNATQPDFSRLEGVELYRHKDDIVERDFDDFENENLAGQPEYADVQKMLSEKLRAHFTSDGCQPFKSCE